MEIKISEHVVAMIISSLSEICRVFWTPLLTNALTDVMKLVIATGQRLLGRQCNTTTIPRQAGCHNVLAGPVSTHNPYSNERERKKGDKLQNRGALVRIFITYRSMTSGPVISLPLHGGGGERWSPSKVAHQLFLEFLSFFLSFFFPKSTSPQLEHKW